MHALPSNELPEDFAAHLIDRAADAIVYADAARVIRFWNAGAARIFGYAADEALGASLDLIIPERLRAPHWQGYDEVMRGRESRYGEGDLPPSRRRTSMEGRSRSSSRSCRTGTRPAG